MASLSPQGERATLALIAEHYSALVELREALATEQRAHAETRRELDELREAVTEQAGVPPVTPTDLPRS